MELIGMQETIETAINDPVIKKEARRHSLSTRLAFLPDDVLAQSWFFRLLTVLYYYYFIYFHAFEVVGMEKIDPHASCLFIARHSSHNGEILGTIVSMYHTTGRVLRSLVHRQLPKFFPFMRLMGSVPGERRSALSLLKTGFWVIVVPGGADEGMVGHENAYKVYWPERRQGFAHIATQAKAPIVPLFLANVEEMRWNPILCLWNFLGLGRLFSYIVQLRIPVVGHLILLLASTVWFLVTFIQIPIPVKLTMFIGKPVEYDMSRDTIADVVERSHNDLQSLINRHQPYGKSYSKAVQQRLQCLVKYWKETLIKANGH